LFKTHIADVKAFGVMLWRREEGGWNAYLGLAAGAPTEARSPFYYSIDISAVLQQLLNCQQLEYLVSARVFSG
jgi:hypothetical protein